MIDVRGSLALGDAPYCTPELYKECADPALGKKKAFEHIWPGSLRKRSSHAHTESPDISRSEAKRYVQKFIRNFWFLFPFSDFLVERDNDYCVCETPCNMTRYSKELSFVKIPSKASAKYLAKKYNKSEQYIKWAINDHCIDEITPVIHKKKQKTFSEANPLLHRDNILVLDIFFEALNYETIEQKKAYEVAGLLGTDLLSCIIYEGYRSVFVVNDGFNKPSYLISGDIGGHMGLFIGASVLTILELFDYLYEVRHAGACVDMMGFNTKGIWTEVKFHHH